MSSCPNHLGDPQPGEIAKILRDRFGYDGFRAGQEPVIRALLEGRSSLAVFPTGGGKSLCYQLPAILADGLTLVVSPLIALMRDQVDGLIAKGIPAARLDSTLERGEIMRVYEQLEANELRLLYVAPERFANERFRQCIKGLRVSLVAVDEAHCISEWGHHFRPDYLKLATIFRRLKIPRVLCLTATATPKVARDIRKAFRIGAADHVQLSFHRPNLDLRVTPCVGAGRKSLLRDRLISCDGSAVVYVTRQETAEEVATFLAKEGLSARAYHAGLPAEFRAEAQRAFMAGETRVMVATIAFGMGIDKSDIRAVFHYNLPKSIESYTQEIGRAGRDGQLAICEMLACGEDLTVLENFIHADAPSAVALENLVNRVLRLGRVFDVSPYELSSICDIRPGVVATVMTYLEMAGIVEVTGTFYETYRIQLIHPLEKLCAGRAPREQAMIKRLLAAGEMKRWWLNFQPTRLAAQLELPREKIVSVLSDLQAAGDAILQMRGVRHGYRIKKAPEDLKQLTHELVGKFRDREDSDLVRLQKVLDLSAQRNCLTGYLTQYFGEKLSTPCGHCDRCRGVPARKIKRPKPRRVTDDELQMVRELVGKRHAALGTPRQLAKFLCGMASPAAIRARLTRSPAFALLSDLPFAEVLAIAEAS